MAENVKKDRVASVVEGALSAVSRIRHAAQGAIRLYNTIAEHTPIPLPKLPDGSKRVWPKERYTPPPPRPASSNPAPPTPPARTAMPKSEPMPPPVVAPRAASSTSPTAASGPPGTGLVVELAGPSIEDYRATRAKNDA